MAQSFKVTFNGETRRVPASIVPDIGDFESFHTALTALFPVSDRLVVQYKDEDGDHVTVRSSLELSEAFASLPGACISFLLREDTWASDNHMILSGHDAAPVCEADPNAAPLGPPKAAPAPLVESSPYEANPRFEAKAPRAAAGPMRPKEALEQAQRLSVSGLLTEARDLLLHTSQKHPSVPLVWVRLTIAQAQLGRYEEALDAYERAAAEGFSNLKLSLTDEDLKPIRGHPRFTTLLLTMVKEKYQKSSPSSEASLGGFIAAKILFFRRGGANPQDVLSFARACLKDSEVDDDCQLFYQSAVTAAVCHEGELTVDLVRRAAEAGFKMPEKIKNDPAFDFIRPHLEGSISTIIANKRAAKQTPSLKQQPMAPPTGGGPATAADLRLKGPAFLPRGTVPTAPVPIPCHPSKEHPQLATLRALGFTNPDHVLIAHIKTHRGNLNSIVASLVG